MASFFIIPGEAVVIWHATVNLSLTDRYTHIHSLLVFRRRVRYANLDRDGTKCSFAPPHLNRIILLLGIHIGGEKNPLFLAPLIL